jgi:hypothetical protein
VPPETHDRIELSHCAYYDAEQSSPARNPPIFQQEAHWYFATRFAFCPPMKAENRTKKQRYCWLKVPMEAGRKHQQLGAGAVERVEIKCRRHA